MLNVVFKRALIIVSPTNSEWGNYCLGHVQECLGQRGIVADLLPIKTEHLNDPKLQSPFAHKFIEVLKAANQKYDFIFSINRMPSNKLTIATDAGSVDIYSFSSIPIVTWMVDNIGHRIDFMKTHPLGGVEETVLVADAASINNGDAAGLRLTDASFFPMWGPARTSAYNHDQRTIPILFVGSIFELEPIALYREQAAGSDAVLQGIFDRVVERMIDDTGTIDAFSITRAEARTVDREEHAPAIFQVVDLMLRRRRRKAAIQAFRHIPISICGHVTDPEIRAQSNISFIGMKNLNDVVALAQQTRILLGDFANFVDGVELRPSIAMANGCVFACTENTYFGEHFPTDAFISTLDEHGPIEARIEDALADRNFMESTDRLAGEIYGEMRTIPPLFMD